MWAAQMVDRLVDLKVDSTVGQMGACLAAQWDIMRAQSTVETMVLTKVELWVALMVVKMVARWVYKLAVH